MGEPQPQVLPPQDPFAPVALGEHFQITPSGLDVKGRPSFETCEHLWQALRTLERSLQFAIGDAMRYFKVRFGERASQIIDAAGISESTASVYEWTATKVAPEHRRMDRLSYKHHQIVARLPADEQAKLLNAAADAEEPWSTRRLERAVRTGADQPVTSWVVVVYCDSEEKRAKLMRELESRAFRCKAGERRGEKEDG